MPIETVALRIYGRHDLRLEKFELPDPADDEIVAEVVSNSICMSTHKGAVLGPEHKRVPDDVAERPTILGHEFAGRILQVGAKWADRFEPGQKFGIQPALMYEGSTDAPGYSYPWVGGNAHKIIIPQEVMVMDCLLPYEGDAFFKASLAEPMSCIVGAFRAQYHHPDPADYVHEFGIIEGGNCALLASAGPMGQGAIDFALHGPRRPRLLLVTDISPERIERTRRLFTVEDAAKNGVRLVYVNPAELPGGPGGLVDCVRDLTGGEMMDDVFVYFPNAAVIEQGDAMLARDGCLNFFAGPQDKAFMAPVNFYNVHYERHHLVGTSGGNTRDMLISLELMAEGRINPAVMITHVGGLDSAADTILRLPEIHGGKKLVYTHVRMPMTAIGEFAERAEGTDEPLKGIYAELARLTSRDGLWTAEAEEFLLSRPEARFDP